MTLFELSQGQLTLPVQQKNYIECNNIKFSLNLFIFAQLRSKFAQPPTPPTTTTKQEIPGS